MLRWWTPVMVFRRTATVDTRLSGVDIPAGDQVVVSFAAANRDETTFADPDRFDITRRGAEHLVFGHGAHFCRCCCTPEYRRSHRGGHDGRAGDQGRPSTGSPCELSVPPLGPRWEPAERQLSSP